MELAVYSALKTYSNVHRGTGHNSMVTTELFERARKIILKYLRLNEKKYVVVFCSPRRYKIFKVQLKSFNIFVVSSKDFDLPFGIRALAVKKKYLKKRSVVYTGGGMIKHVTANYIVWADIPERFEAGTPNIVNIIALAKAIQLVNQFGKIFNKKLRYLVKTSKEILYNDEMLEYSGLKLLHKLRKSLIGHDVRVPTEKTIKKFINLDNAASTPSFLPIWNTYRTTLMQPNEVHKEIIEEVKHICAKFFNAPSDKYEVIFTSNTTEAVNIVAKNLTIHKDGLRPVVINTLLEHHSNELPFRSIPGVSLIRVSVSDEGFINLDELKMLLNDYNHTHKYGNKRVQLVAVSGVSNVLGTINDLKSISQITHQYGASLLIDAAQLVAHHKTDLLGTNIDYLVFSGHKVYAPFGSGALIVRRGELTFDTYELNNIKSSGEENVIGIATLGKSLLLLRRIGFDVIEEYERKLTELILDGLSKMEDVEVFGVKKLSSGDLDKRSSIISFSMKKVPHNLAAKEIAEYGGIGVRSGCFCAHMLIQQILKVQKIRAVGARMTSIIIPAKTGMLLPGTIRVSIGIENSETEIMYFLQIVRQIISKPRSNVNKILARIYNGAATLPKTHAEERIKTYVKSVVQKIF